MMGSTSVRCTRWGLAWVLVVALTACSGQRNDSSAGNGRLESANPESTEMLDWSYGYLVAGDPDFTRMAPNYSTLRPFTRDTALVVETRSEAAGQDPPPPDQPQYFHLRVNRPLAVRFIVADSLGKGIITYEFADVPVGAYTLGSKGWPLPQTELTAGHRWVYAFFVGDRRFRNRFTFLLDDEGHFLYMPPEDSVS
jgi:hypothetical protein